MFADQFAGAVARAQFSEVNALALALWRAHAAGHLDDATAQQLAEQLEARRPKGGQRRFASARVTPRRQRSPDKAASIERRRRLAACWPLPPAIAAAFTVSEQAALRVIADEMKRYGSCSMFVDKVAALAGTCRTVVKNALRKARALRLLTVEERRRRGQRSLTNVVRFLCMTWRHWITRRKIGGIFPSTTIDGVRSEGKSEAVERFAQSPSIKKIASLVPAGGP